MSLCFPNVSVMRAEMSIQNSFLAKGSLEVTILRARCSESWNLNGPQTLNFHVILEQSLHCFVCQLIYLQNISYRYVLRIRLEWYLGKYFWKFKVAVRVLGDIALHVWVDNSKVPERNKKKIALLNRDHPLSL